MENTQLNGIKQYAKAVLIIACVFAVISSVLLIIVVCGFPQMIKGRSASKYLYENGIEVDAHFKYYYDNYGPSGAPSSIHPSNTRKMSGRFLIVYEYVDDNNRTYTDEYRDTVECKTRDELSVREQYIKQMTATDGKTMKMLIADNGLCCLSVYKESLLKPTTLVVYIIIISVSPVVLGLCIFGIVRQSKILRRFSKLK